MNTGMSFFYPGFFLHRWMETVNDSSSKGKVVVIVVGFMEYHIRILFFNFSKIVDNFDIVISYIETGKTSTK